MSSGKESPNLWAGQGERVAGAPVWKRALDIFCIIATAPAWLILGSLIALAIRLSSPGPIFFRQERIGYQGRPFLILKFRTMMTDADTSVHRKHLEDLIDSKAPLTKLDSTGDKRLIPGGLFLRSLGLDELPQLLNVLRGEMSLVGPRPFIPYEHERLQPRHRGRSLTLPGLTGLWQVSGKNRTTFQEMINFDLHYVAKRSLILDLKIMLLTFPALMSQAADLNKFRKFFRWTVPGPTRFENGRRSPNGKERSDLPADLGTKQHAKN